MENNDRSNIKELMSNEQTFLAWIRTGIEVIIFGIVSIKFSLFSSEIVGITLVGAGSVMTLLAYFRYRKTYNELQQGDYKYSITMLTITTIFLFAISVILMFCLIKSFLNPEKNKKNESMLIKHRKPPMPQNSVCYFKI